MRVKTIHGIIEIDPPAGYNPGAWKIEIDGYLPSYKGFVASYHHGAGQVGESERLFGQITNLNVHALILLGGDSMAEFTADFHEAVDGFLSSFANAKHPHSRYGIAHYTSDPAILSYYATHYGHVPSPVTAVTAVTGVAELAEAAEAAEVSFPLYIPSLGMSV